MSERQTDRKKERERERMCMEFQTAVSCLVWTPVLLKAGSIPYFGAISLAPLSISETGFYLTQADLKLPVKHPRLTSNSASRSASQVLGLYVGPQYAQPAFFLYLINLGES